MYRYMLTVNNLEGTLYSKKRALSCRVEKKTFFLYICPEERVFRGFQFQEYL
jgi:hypothetical protein